MDNKHIDIYELATKKLDNSLTKDEEDLLSVMLKDVDNQKIVNDIEKIMSTPQMEKFEVDTEKALNTLNQKIEGVTSLKTTPLYKQKFIIWYAAAASIILFIGIFTYTNSVDQQKQITISNNDNGVQSFQKETWTKKLPDSSSVKLSPGSSISYPHEFAENNRFVELQGSGFFNISKDSLKPFIIHTSSIDVEVLGTSFYINRLPDLSTSVFVKTGKVKVTDKTNNTIILTANQEIKYNTKDSSFSEISSPNQNNLFWDTKTLSFKRAKMEEIISSVNFWYKQDISIGDSVANCKLTVTFQNNSIEDILEIITASLDIEFSNKDGKIKIYGNPCQ